jgi:hypothetical protein
MPLSLTMETLKKREPMNYKNIFLTLIIVFAIQGIAAQGNSETRNFVKSAPVSRGTSLDLSNKYGRVEITTWNKDSVMIRAEVKAIASNHDKLDNMFDGVNINFSESKSFVRAETSFSQNINMLFESFKGMTSKLITYDSRIEINYYINVPEYMNMKVENKYGDVYMENTSGELTLSLSNGSFKAGAIGNNSNLSLTFCDASIAAVGSGRINASFSEISAESTGDLTISSISSKFSFRKSGKLSVESRRDKFRIDNLISIKGNSYFTDFNLSGLKKEATLTARYGKVDIQDIESGFDAINLNTSYNDITLGFESGSSYSVDIRHLNSFLVISDKSARTEKKVLNEDKKEYVTSGTVGKSSGNAKVSIDASHGDIYIK